MQIKQLGHGDTVQVRDVGISSSSGGEKKHYFESFVTKHKLSSSTLQVLKEIKMCSARKVAAVDDVMKI